MMPSKIEWTDETWNPIAGCTKCSPGCLNCYAERMSARLAHMGQRKYQDVVKGTINNWFIPEWNNQIHCCDEYENVLDKPLHWRKPRRIFVCSMSDLFHPKVPFEFIDKVFDVIRRTPDHTYQILTKRPERMKDFIYQAYGVNHKLDNAWLGISISNQAEADEKIPILLWIPAAVRFLSIEPMLGAIDLRCVIVGPRRRCVFDCLRGTAASEIGVIKETVCGTINGVIVGCESGPKRRPCEIKWVQGVVDQCKAANVPVFVKQINQDGQVVKMPQAFPQQLPERK